MPLSPNQKITLQTARSTLVKQGRLDDRGYRLILKNAAGVESSTASGFTNAGFEQVMAAFEEMGFQKPGNPTYWRDKIGGGNRLSKAERMNYLILNLAKQVTRYTLPQMIANITGGDTHSLDGLDNQQRYNLIEAYKDLLARQERNNRQGKLFDSPPAPEGSGLGAGTDAPARTPATVKDDDATPGTPAARAMTPATTVPRDVFDDIPF